MFTSTSYKYKSVSSENILFQISQNISRKKNTIVRSIHRYPKTQYVKID